MIATRVGLLQMLPAYKDAWVVINADQTVRDIISEVLNAHEEFRSSYDIIAPVFDYGTTDEICNALYSFCKHEIQYKEEGDELQTTAIPAGILTRGYGDCKHYAGFVAGVLDALNRRGKNIQWCYRFASYRILDKTPHHVFVVVKDGGREKWIDATPEANGREPIWIVDKKVNSMALVRNIAGIDDTVETIVVPDVNAITQDQLEAALAEVDTSLDMDEQTLQAFQTLSVYNQPIYGRVFMNEQGIINADEFNLLLSEVSEQERASLQDAYNKFTTYLQRATIGNIFSDVWRATKVATLAIPRNAFLGLVALNVFGMASKMSRLLSIPDAKKKLVDKWYSLGGKESGITSAINSGAKKKAILGSVNGCIEGHSAVSVGSQTIGVAAAAAPAWLAIAGGIIAAIMPLVTSLLKQNNQYTSEFAAIDAGNYGGYAGGGNFLDTIKNFVVQNPIPSIAGAALIIYLLWKE